MRLHVAWCVSYSLTGVRVFIVHSIQFYSFTHCPLLSIITLPIASHPCVLLLFRILHSLCVASHCVSSGENVRMNFFSSSSSLLLHLLLFLNVKAKSTTPDSAPLLLFILLFGPIWLLRTSLLYFSVIESIAPCHSPKVHLMTDTKQQTLHPSLYFPFSSPCLLLKCIPPPPTPCIDIHSASRLHSSTSSHLIAKCLSLFSLQFHLPFAVLHLQLPLRRVAIID